MAKRKTIEPAGSIRWTNVRVRLGDLRPWADNPRMSSKAQAKRILTSFNEFGQVETVAVSPSPDLSVYDGHQRLSALLTVHGEDYEIDARQSSRALSDDERRRLVVLLHAGAVGSFDWDMLANWDDALLKSSGFDDDLLKQLHRDAAAVAEMLMAADPVGDEADAESDKAEELREKWQTATGQVWQIGNHRAMCGDSTNKDDVVRLIGGRVDIIVTDPPYELDVETVRAALSLFTDRAVLLVTGKQAYTMCVEGWEHHMDLVWRHRQPRSFPTMNQPVMYHNPIVMATRPGVKLGWQRPQNNFGSIIEVEGTEFEKSDFGHTKAVDLFVQMMRGFKFEVWGDPFLGAGTSLLAAERLNKRLLGMELSAATLAVALERFKQSGLSPRLAQTSSN